jgi:replication factor C small subunit
VLVEKYRPQKVKQVLLPARLKRLFKTFIDEQEIQNLVIYSKSPGSGKTTIAKALANDCDYDYIYINASMHSGIATLRDTIAQYASVKAFGGKKKVIILDEFDFATPNLQAGLRGAIEEYIDKCRFILTANTISKIIKPLRSRCTEINFDFTEADKDEVKDSITKRLCSIADREDIKYVDGVMDDVVTAFYPDIRKMIGSIGEYSRLYGTIDKDIFNFREINDELKNTILSLDFKATQQYILDQGYAHEDLYRYMFDEVITVVDNSIKAELYKLTSEYLDMSSRSRDQEITFAGYLVSLMDILGEV